MFNIYVIFYYLLKLEIVWKWKFICSKTELKIYEKTHVSLHRYYTMERFAHTYLFQYTWNMYYDEKRKC
jgi:hypothetical protein